MLRLPLSLTNSVAGEPSDRKGPSVASRRATRALDCHLLNRLYKINVKGKGGGK